MTSSYAQASVTAIADLVLKSFHRSQNTEYAMTAGPSINLPGWMAEQLFQASPDLLRQMVQRFAEALMSADVDAVCGAGYASAARTAATRESNQELVQHLGLLVEESYAIQANPSERHNDH